MKGITNKAFATSIAAVLACGLLPAAALADDGVAAEAEAEAALELLETASYTGSFTFSDSGITASDDSTGYKVDGTTLKITASGTYRITGTCAEGAIQVNKGTTGVTLVLEDLDLTSSATAPLAVNKNNGDTQLIVLGTVTLTDAEDPANEDSADEAAADAFEGAAIKVKSGSNLVIDGTGTLLADGSACKNGIKGADGSEITIAGAAVRALAANNGIASDHAVTITGGTVEVAAGKDGIKADVDEDDTASEGIVTISGGTVSVDATDDGITSSNVVNITGGAVDVKADDGLGNGNSSSDGIKGANETNITGGTVTVAASDDGIKSDYTLTIGSDGADGPTVTVSESYEGLEGAVVNIKSGTVRIAASDDGINAANSDLGSYAFAINISGGTTYVDAGGDGLDSNGDINVSGGYTEAFSATNNGDNAIDWGDGGSFGLNWTGGTLVGVGMNGMQEMPTSGLYVGFGLSGFGGMGGMQGGFGGGQQGGTMPGFGGGQQGGFRTMSADEDGSSIETLAAGGFGQSAGGVSISAGSTMTVTDSSGAIVYEGTAPKTANSMLLLSDALVEGQTYTLSVNGEQAATATASQGSGSGSTQPGQSGGGAQPGQPGQPGEGSEPPAKPGDGEEPPAQPGDGEQPDQPGQPGDDAEPPAQPGDTTDPTTPGDPDTPAVSYTDVPSWYEQAVSTVSQAGVMTGYSPTVFGAQNPLTRANMVTILWRAETGNGSDYDYSSDTLDADVPFTDVPDGSYYTQAANWAFAEGIITEADAFNGSEPITMQQMVAMIARYNGASAASDTSVLGRYADGDQVSSYAKGYVAWGVGQGLVGNASNLSPASSIQRARAAQILANAIEANLI